MLTNTSKKSLNLLGLSGDIDLIIVKFFNFCLQILHLTNPFGLLFVLIYTPTKFPQDEEWVNELYS